MDYAKPLLLAVVLASLTLTACNGATGEVEERVATAEQAAIGNNGLTDNAIGNNAIGNNAIANSAIANDALASKSLAANSLLNAELENADSRELFQYIVSCALPASSVINVTVAGVPYSFPGGLGVAPEWGEPDGSCGDSCQQWVSACVIARIDYLGVTRSISLRGADPGLQTSATERATYTVDEATYYGNLFTSPMHAYACLAPGQTEDTRVCGPTVASCGVVDVLGPCEELCGPQTWDGSFPNCWVPPTRSGRGWTLPQLYEGSITVFLQP